MLNYQRVAIRSCDPRLGLCRKCSDAARPLIRWCRRVWSLFWSGARAPEARGTRSPDSARSFFQKGLPHLEVFRLWMTHHPRPHSHAFHLSNFETFLFIQSGRRDRSLEQKLAENVCNFPIGCAMRLAQLPLTQGAAAILGHAAKHHG